MSCSQSHSRLQLAHEAWFVVTYEDSLQDTVYAEPIDDNYDMHTAARPHFMQSLPASRNM